MKPEFNLNELPKKNIFRTPDDYFEELPSRIMARCTTTPAGSRFSVLWSNFRPALAGFLVVLGVFALFFLNRTEKTPQQQHIALAALSQKEVMDYLLTAAPIEPGDLTELSATDQDLTHLFIRAAEQDLQHELEDDEYMEELLLI